MEQRRSVVEQQLSAVYSALEAVETITTGFYESSSNGKNHFWGI